MPQRKNRNATERDAVCRGALAEAASAGIPLDAACMVALMTVLDKYASMDESHGEEVRGTVPSGDIRPGSVIEYVLPSRRILRPVVRLTSAKNVPPNGTS
jgi:hypothetical protein